MSNKKEKIAKKLRNLSYKDNDPYEWLYGILSCIKTKGKLKDLTIDGLFKCCLKSISDIIKNEYEETCSWKIVRDNLHTLEEGIKQKKKYWILDCGCWRLLDKGIGCFDVEDGKPEYWNFCPKCGARIVE